MLSSDVSPLGVGIQQMCQNVCIVLNVEHSDPEKTITPAVTL